jgi:hypothetical protein
MTILVHTRMFTLLIIQLTTRASNRAIVLIYDLARTTVLDQLHMPVILFADPFCSC